MGAVEQKALRLCLLLPQHPQLQLPVDRTWKQETTAHEVA
jgi:hypothetical protein